MCVSNCCLVDKINIINFMFMYASNYENLTKFVKQIIARIVYYFKDKSNFTDNSNTLLSAADAGTSGSPVIKMIKSTSAIMLTSS